MKKLHILALFAFFSFTLVAQVQQSGTLPMGCKPANVPAPVPIKSNLQSKLKAVAATGITGNVESIHSAFVNWQTGGFTSFSIGTGSVPNGPNSQNIRWSQGLNNTDKTTYGYSYEELRLTALALGTTFMQGQNFYFHLLNGGTDTVIGPLNFTWQNLGTAGNMVNVTIETQFGVNGLGGFANWQATNMMDFYSKVIPIIAQIYGPSSHSYTVNVVNDGNASGSNTFYNGPNWISTQYTADAFGKMTQPRLMVHELLHAWRDNVCLSSDNLWHYQNTLSGFEEGMAECVAQIVMDKFAAAYPNYFPAGTAYLNKHWGHEDGYAFDWDYDFQNHSQLTTTDFWSSDQGIGAHWERYGTSSAAFYKMYVEDSDVFKKFNAEYYRRMNADHTLLTSRSLLVDIFSTVLPKVEEKETNLWIDKQRILDCKVIPGKKVHMLSFQGADGVRDMGHDNRIHLIETQNLPGGNEWSWDKLDNSGNITQRWFHQLNNSSGKIDIVNYTTGAVNNTLNFRNNDAGYYGPNQGPCLPPSLTGTPCFPTGIDGHGLYTTSADRAITNGGINDGSWYNGLGLNPDRIIYKIQTTGLYIYNIEFQSGGAVKGKYYRLHGNGFIGKDGLYAGVRNNDDTPVLGKMYVEQKNTVSPIAGEETAITINNGTLIAPRIWTSIAETQSQFKAGRVDTRYSKPGKVHAIYVNSDCSKPQKIGFRNITYGSTVSGVQMFLFNVDDFEDILYTESMPTLLCEGYQADFSVENNFPKYLDTDSRVTYKWKNPLGTVVSTSNKYTISAVTPQDAGIYTLEITSFDCLITRTKELVVTPSVVLEPSVVTPISLCANSTIDLKVSGTLPTGTTYSWTGPNGYSNTTQNPSITNAQTINAGIYEVTCTVKDCDGSTDIIKKEQIQVGINSILKPKISCGVPSQNAVSFLWEAVAGATDYTISYQVNTNLIQNIGAIGNVLTYSVTGLQPSDNVDIFVTPVGSLGTCFDVEKYSCQASTAPTCSIPVAQVVTTAVITCLSPSVTLNGTGSTTGAGIDYQWTTTDGSIVSGATTLNPIVDAAGTYKLIVTNTAGGGCSSLPVTVNVTGAYSLPTVPTLTGPNSICLGSDANFTITGKTGDNVSYTGAVSGTAVIETTGSVVVTIPSASSNTTLNLTNTTDGICSQVLTGITKTINIQTTPNAGTNGTLTLCSGTTPTNAQLFVQLGGTPDTGGVWTNVGNIYTYTVNAVSPCNIAATATVTLNTQAVPNAGTNGTLTLCSGTTPTNVQLFAQLGGTPDTSGVWTNAGDIYTYTVNAVSPCNIAATATVTINRQTTPNAGTNGTLTLCSGTAPTNAQLFAQLGGTPDTGGVWTNVGNVYTYTVNAVSPCNLSATATVTINRQTTPNAGTNGTLTLCTGATPTNAQLFAQLGGTPDTGGIWTNVGNVYTYTVNSSSPCNLSATATVTINRQTTPNAGTNGTLTLCSGTTPTNVQLFAQLGGTPDTGGIWTNVGDIYTYTVNAVSPCSLSATATVTINRQTTPNAGTNGTLTLCSGTTPTNAQLFAQLGGTPDAGGVWTNVGNIYTYTVNSSSPCSQTATAIVTLNIQTAPIAEAGSPVIITCASSTIMLNGAGSDISGVTYLWTGGTIDSGANTLTPVVSSSGVYTLTVTNSILGCASSDTVLVTQNIENPDFSFSETGVNQYTIVASGGTAPYQYSINSANSYTSNPIFKIDHSGNYTIYVKDNKGCFSTETAYLAYEGIEFPKFFSPDGNGSNDYWYPTRIEDYPNLEVSIFDRYQRLIMNFKGNTTMGWDGTYQGKPLPTGDYWYVIKTNNDKDRREFIGGMTLFR
ncbi:T9SS type B sorting domain-containing protein [Flavobacterium sp. PL02]|uniref:T9SS type B sorting domain-containing protein n=1 Tax=Flavobacterium sp. PL02 TaxID=3088354 RepID=UPI002B237F3D|nr:T9SS type B sorting domain-containing protein [Flavobacterium sp. PL02]MEA9412802.1 T9SS type B sorting domain-containing protein [Flavobacterium sp. PL02]